MRTCDSENSQWGKCWVGKNYIWNRFELCYGLTCQLSILFIWLNSIDWVFVLVNWNVHIVSVFSISRTAQGSTNAPRLRFAYLYFCWMDKPVCESLVLPNVCLSSLSRRGDWLIDVSVEQFFIRTCFEVVVPFESENAWDSRQIFANLLKT